MNRSMIIIAIMGISLAATTVTLAQDKRRSTRQSVHVNGTAGNDKLAVRKTATKHATTGDTNHDGRRSIDWGDGQNESNAGRKRQITASPAGGNYTFRSVTTGGNGSNVLSGTPTANGTFSRGAITFEGNDEPLWAKARQNSSTSANAVGNARNVGPDIHGNVRPKGFANTTFDDQAALSANKGPTQQLVQGNQIGVNARPRRGSVTGDFDGDGAVDGADFLMKGSSQKQKQP